MTKTSPVEMPSTRAEVVNLIMNALRELREATVAPKGEHEDEDSIGLLLLVIDTAASVAEKAYGIDPSSIRIDTFPLEQMQ
jgi:hypothetical protein